MAVSREMIADIKNSVNIVDVIGEVVSLSRAGRNYLGLCPFHKEKTPSFNVVEDKQFFHCFGCGKSGDVFKFLEEYRQISFMESVSLVAERAGITIDYAPSQVSVSRENPNQPLYDIHREAADFYHAVLMTTKEGQLARDYLASRGLTDDVLTYFNIGLSPNASDFLYRALGKKYSETVLTNSGLFNVDEGSNQLYDAFKNRIMFPLTNDKGEVIAFSGRIWTPDDQNQKLAKYKNSRSTAIFNKSYELYHADRAKAVAQKTHELYLMEGFMDVIAAYQAGIVNAVASMGTALTPEHINHIRRFTKKVVLTYDGDNAGQEAIAKSLSLLDDLAVDIVRIPNGMDPDEFLRKQSPEALKHLLEQGRISSTEFYIHHLKPDNLDNLQAEIAYVEQIAAIIAKVPSITAQNTYITKVAELLPDFDYFQIEQSVNNERLAGRRARQTETVGQVQVVDLPVTKRLSILVKTEIQLFHRLLHHDYILQTYRNRSDFAFDTPELEQLYRMLCQRGSLSSFDLAEVDDKVRQMYYRVLEENLPEDVSSSELSDLEERRQHLLAERSLHKQSKQIRESSNQGDIEGALSALENLIAQKRNME